MKIVSVEAAAFAESALFSPPGFSIRSRPLLDTWLFAGAVVLALVDTLVLGLTLPGLVRGYATLFASASMYRNDVLGLHRGRRTRLAAAPR